MPPAKKPQEMCIRDSIYMLSLLETCEETGDDMSDLIIVENPEIFLHPKLQNESGDILYRLSKKCQVIFSTHAANLLSNFNSRQIDVYKRQKQHIIL